MRLRYDAGRLRVTPQVGTTAPARRLSPLVRFEYACRPTVRHEAAQVTIRSGSLAAVLLISWPAAWAQTVDPSVGAGSTVAIVFTLATVAMKITAIVIGYLIVKLGHDTLIRGITGEIDFGFKGEGVGVKLKSGSPGAAFVLAGAAIVIWALLVDKPFEMKAAQPAAAVEQLPDKPKPDFLE